MVKSGNSKPTKELILDAAFSFLKEPRYSTFSMNELAERVGITKPAIYRHFKNKEAVLAAMEARVLDGMSGYLVKLNSQIDVRIPLSGLIDYFIKNPTYINYLIAQMSSTPNYEEHIFGILYEKDIEFVKGNGENAYLKKFNSDIKMFSQHVFCGMTMFFFIKVQERLKEEGKIQGIPEDFAGKIVNLLLTGLRGVTKSDDALYPQQISDERKSELINLCKIDSKTFPAENRIFTALANVIEKYKIPGVTVERIANELNMAKSSLYEYFDNKNEMIKSLINKELQLLQTITIENSAEAKTFTEYILVLLASEIEYFSHRPSIIPICGWLLMGGTDISNQERKCNENEGEASPWEKKLPERVISPDLGFPYSPELITGWIKCLPVAFLVEAKGKNLSKEKRMEGFMLMIDYILNGVQEENK